MPIEEENSDVALPGYFTEVGFIDGRKLLKMSLAMSAFLHCLSKLVQISHYAVRSTRSASVHKREEMPVVSQFEIAALELLDSPLPSYRFPA
jgi:hypothetical protein